LGRAQEQSGTVSGNKESTEQELSGLPVGTFSVFRRLRFPVSARPADFSSSWKIAPGKDVKFLSDNLNTFLAAARKRPEIGLVT